jgi:hypothetical protein
MYTAPRCRLCCETVWVSTGLPVSVAFKDGCFTLDVDTTELPCVEFEDIICECQPGEPDITDEERIALHAALDRIARDYAPEINAEVPDTPEV